MALLGLGCASCTEAYLARRDTLSAGSGDAVQANIATHVIDPWPAEARRTDAETSGERVQHAIERYRNPSSAGAAAPSPPLASSFGAAAAQAVPTR